MNNADKPLKPILVRLDLPDSSGPGCCIRNPLQSAVASNTPADVTRAQEGFFHATNAAAVEGVVEAIESQVELLLPEGISKSARNRP